MDIPNKSWTKCPKCERKQFELVEDYPTGSRYKFWYMRCSSCKTFLQALPYFSESGKLEEIAEDIKKIKSAMNIY